MVSDQEMILRLVIITVIAAAIGMEREFHHKPAGLRTNVMVGLGSTLMTIASIKAVDLTGGMAVDPTRIAAQIVSGIGFIGAGAILRPTSATNSNVIGLTTAATLWVVAGLGIAVGMGFYREAIASTLLVLFTFLALGKMVNALRRYTKSHPPQSVLEDEEVMHGHHSKETIEQ